MIGNLPTNVDQVLIIRLPIDIKQTIYFKTSYIYNIDSDVFLDEFCQLLLEIIKEPALGMSIVYNDITTYLDDGVVLKQQICHPDVDVVDIANIAGMELLEIINHIAVVLDMSNISIGVFNELTLINYGVVLRYIRKPLVPSLSELKYVY